MKKTGISAFLLLLTINLNAQTIFWIENFNNGCNLLCTSYTGPNGAWTFASTGAASACGAPTTPNLWYISCAENGNAPGSCGTTCTTGDATLHVGNDPASPSAVVFCPTGDCGAAYDAGGYCNILSTPPSTETDILATSPVIDCSVQNTITLTFNYIERGQGTNDNATVMYDDGTGWVLLSDMPKTPTTCAGGQGRWTTFSIALPASADNNPNVRLAFRWLNDDDGGGNDPSFAVDSVRLTVTSGGVPPVANFFQGNTAACDSICITFTDSSTGATSLAWSFPGGTPSTSTQSNPTVCYFTPGTFDVILVATNSFGTDSIVKPALVVITPTPVPDFTTSDQSLCVGECITYTDLSTGTIQSYTWTFQGGTPGISSQQTPPSICYNIAGFFQTTLAVINNGCPNTITRVNYISVTQPTPPTVNVQGDTLISSNALTYQWYNLATGAIPAAIFNFYVATQSGDYYVCITDAFGCQACSDTVHVDFTGISETDLHSHFHLYPNPAVDEITLSTKLDLQGLQLRMQDFSGRVIREQPLNFSNNKTVVSIREVAAGSYLVQVLNDKKKVIYSISLLKQ